MQNFEYYSPTKIIFGKQKENQVGQEVKKYGSKILLHYGRGHIKKTGLYDKVVQSLVDAGVEYIELGGVKPNPELGLVKKGIEICKSEQIDFVLSVGGGSVIDSGKAIAMGACYDGDVWDFYDKRIPAQKALPVGVILTIPAAGSESSPVSVITKEEGLLKVGYPSDLLRPRFAILNPELTYTLPAWQTAAGIVDMMAHIMERYFTNERFVDASDHFCEGLMRTILKYAPIVIEEPENYNARAEIMWVGTLAHNDIAGLGRIGDWATHQIEHELSALYDVTHGAGLAVLFPAWIQYVYKNNPKLFVKFFVRVFDVEPDFHDDDWTIAEGLKRLKAFYRSIGMPVSLKELNIGEDNLELMAQKATAKGPRGNLIKLYKEDTLEIFKLVR